MKRRRRTERYLVEPGGLLVEELVIDGERVNIYRWKDNPVELWYWNPGPAGPTRIDMRGLESHPSADQLDPALAMLAGWREQWRRETGRLAGPGRPAKMSPSTKEKYEKLADAYWDAQESDRDAGERGPTLAEFAQGQGVSTRTLQRALKHRREGMRAGVRKTDEER